MWQRALSVGGGGGGHFAKAPLTGLTLSTSFQNVTTNDVTTNQPFTPKGVALSIAVSNSSKILLAYGYIDGSNSSWTANTNTDGDFTEYTNEYMEIISNGFKIKAPNSVWAHKAYWIAWD